MPDEFSVLVKWMSGVRGVFTLTGSLAIRSCLFSMRMVRNETVRGLIVGSVQEQKIFFW
jgi:hypothetical protein